MQEEIKGDKYAAVTFRHENQINMDKYGIYI